MNSIHLRTLSDVMLTRRRNLIKSVSVILFAWMSTGLTIRDELDKTSVELAKQATRCELRVACENTLGKVQIEFAKKNKRSDCG